MTVEELIAFEKEISADFEAGRIAAPIHLAGGNEEHLIRLFDESIDIENDWVCCQWRSHYHCLLKGVPQAKLRQAIYDGRSIALAFPEHKIVSSAIVGGIAPIALGIAWAIKRKGGSETVWVFIGDMTSETGIVHETAKYARGHDLPIRFIVEDNHMSVCTDTWEVWGDTGQIGLNGNDDRYVYKLGWPHTGIGRWVSF